MRRSSELRASQLKPVSPETLAASRQRTDLGFTKEFFIYHIDKFFSFELSVVLNATDDEYQKYLATHKQADDEFQKQIEDLDDYFLNDSPREIEQAPEDMAVQKQLEKTVKEFERSLTENKFQTQEEKQELENVIKTLKNKINDLERKASVKQLTDRASTL